VVDSLLPRGRWFLIGYGIILALLIIYLATLVDFIFIPFVVLFSTLFAPVVISGVLYYLIRPLVNLLDRIIPRTLAIVLIYLVFIGVIFLVVYLLGPTLQKQLMNLGKNIPDLVEELKKYIGHFQNTDVASRFKHSSPISLDDLSKKFEKNASGYISSIGSNIISIIGLITNVVVLIILVPFILFYMLKDGKSLPRWILKFVPEEHTPEGEKIIEDMDEALSSYIQGQIIVSVSVGILIYIGFLSIGIDYPLVLALIAMFTNVIPFVGPFIGTIPSVVVGFLHSPTMGIWVLVVIIIVQQIDGNFISPQVMGKKLDIHPLTIILLLMVAGNFAGVLGLILAVPFYAVAKVIVTNTYRIILLRRLK
jgi:predicted PurR-regulated permease PerM